MKRINFHKIISSILVMSFVLGQLTFFAEADDTELLYENFEVANADVGREFSGWNGWNGVYSAPSGTITVEDSEYTIIQDPGNEANKLLKLSRPTSSASSLQYEVSKSLAQTATSGIVSLSFKLMRTTDVSENFLLRLYDKDSKNWDIIINMKQSFISCGQVVRFKEYTQSNPATELNRWYDMEFRFDLSNKSVDVFQDGELLASDIGFVNNYGNSISKICIGTHRSAAGSGAVFLVDDVKVKGVGKMELVSHSPANNTTNIDVNEKIVLTFSQEVNEDELTSTNVQINNGVTASLSLHPEDNKKVIVTPSLPLMNGTTYTVLVSGIKDIYGQVAADKSFSFTSRSARMYFEEPKFYLDYEGEKTPVENTQTASGVVTAEITAVKETSQNSDVLLVLETLQDGQRVSLAVKHYELIGGNTAPQTITIESDIEEGNTLRLSILDNWLYLKPYTGRYTFSESGLDTEEFTAGTTVKTMRAQTDYEAGKLKISGETQQTEATVALAVLAPGYEPTTITPSNAGTVVCEILFVKSDENGDFTTQIDTAPYEKDVKYTLIASGEKSSPFIICTDEQITLALDAVKNASADELKDLIEGKEEWQTGIMLNDVLQLDLTDYELLIEPDTVIGSLSGRTFPNIAALRNAYYSAVEQQANDETRLKEVLELINNASKDNMESTLKACDDVITIDWSTDFTKLNSADKDDLYNSMAEYPFNKTKEIETVFETKVGELLEKKNILPDECGENILIEDFNSSDAVIGKDVLGWREWSGGYNNPTGEITVKDSYIKIAADSENPANKVMKAYRTTCSANSIYYTVEKTLPEIQSKGVVRYGMKIKRMNSSTSILRLSMIDHKETYWDITFVMDTSRINCGGTTVKFKENTGNNPPAALNEWYFFDLFFDMDNKKLSVYQNGELLAKDIAFPTNFTGGLQKFGIGPHRSGAGSNSEFLVDDIRLDKVKTLKMIDTLPQNSAQNVGVDGKIKLIFNHKIDPSSLSTNDVTIENSVIQSVEIDAENPKAVLVQTASTLDFNTDYTVNVSGIKDIYGQSAPDASFNFKTRSRRLVFKNVSFYTDYEGAKTDITNSGVQAGEITAEVKLVNEEGTAENLLILLETEQSGKTHHIEVKPYEVLTNTVAEQTVTVSTTAVAGDVLRLMVIDSWTDLNSYAQIYNFNAEGLQTEDVSDTEKIGVAVNYQSNKLEITGKTQKTQSTAIAAVLKTGYTAENITTLNVNDAVCELLQMKSDANGQYVAQTDISSYEKNVPYSIIASDEKTVQFKISTADLITVALNKVKAVTKEELVAMLAGNPQLTVGVPINDVLQLDLSEYNTLSSKVDVTKDVAGKTFNNLNELRTAYYSALERQVAYENRVKEIIKSVNDALWDGFENALKNGSDLLQINWSGDYSKLNETYNSLLYKALAKDYTFTTLKQIEDTFSQKATELYNAQLNAGGTNDAGNDGGNGGGGGGGTSGGVTGPVITNPINMQQNENFNDLDTVPWAKESINALSALGIINGVGNNRFAPNDTVTREQFVKMMVVAFNLDGEETSAFTDVDASAWYAPYIGAAVQNGIINGVSADSFGVGSNITRSDMAVICTRIARKCSIALPEAQEAVYTDAHNIPDYAKESATILQLAGIMTGDGSGCFAPNENATRAMAAKIIHKLMTFTSVR